jgi:hypothetical protein
MEYTQDDVHKIEQHFQLYTLLGFPSYSTVKRILDRLTKQGLSVEAWIDECNRLDQKHRAERKALAERQAKEQADQFGHQPVPVSDEPDWKPEHGIGGK